MRHLRVEMMLEMIQVLEGNNRKDWSAKMPCPRQLAFAFRIVGNERRYQRKEPASKDHQRCIDHRRDGPMDRGDCCNDEQENCDRFADYPRTVSPVSESEYPKPRLKRDAVEKRPPPRHTRGSTFEIVHCRKPFVVMEVSDPVSMPGAKCNQLNRTQQALVEYDRESQRSVHQIVRDRAICHERQKHRAADRCRP